jgi:hypothetical protein
MMQTDAAFARRNDPETSHEAAASIDADTLRDSQRAVLRVLTESGPLTDEEIVGYYCSWLNVTRLPRQSDSGIRTRRKELERLGKVQPDGTKKTASGRNAIVWRAAA